MEQFMTPNAFQAYVNWLEDTPNPYEGVDFMQVMRTWLKTMLVRKIWSEMIRHVCIVQPPLEVMKMMALMTCVAEKEEKKT